MGYIFPIHLGKFIIQNIQHWQKETIVLDDIVKNYFKESFLKMFYVKIGCQVVLKQ